jgi:hypothetical protein
MMGAAPDMARGSAMQRPAAARRARRRGCRFARRLTRLGGGPSLVAFSQIFR